MFKVKTVEELDLVYSILRETYPGKQIAITYDYNTTDYILKVTKEKFSGDPEVPVDLSVKVVYGDSVTGDTPLILRNAHTKKVVIKSINSLVDDNHWDGYPAFKIFDHTIRVEKQFGKMDGYEVWSDQGWTPIKKVIRHKTAKKLYRVVTTTGVVDVTEDHSLVNANLKKVKPKSLREGRDILLHSFPQTFDYCETITEETAEIWGAFFGSGACGGKTSRDMYWTITSNDRKWLESLKRLLDAVYGGYNNSPAFVVFEDILFPGENCLSLTQRLVEQYRKLFWNGEGRKIIPEGIFNSSRKIREAFWRGFKQTPVFTVSGKGKLATQHLYFLLRSLDINVHVQCGKGDRFYLELPDDETPRDTTVQKVIPLSKTTLEEWVYDLETDCGRFGAGIGDIIVSNTDSVMCQFKYNREDKAENRRDTFEMATLCGEKLTNEVFKRPPIEMEFEKVFQPFILLTKKRYIANKYENMKDPFQLKGVDAKGIALTRRDYCQMVKKCYKEIIDTIMNDTTTDDPIQKSISVFKRWIKQIDSYKVDVDDLVVSALLAKSYKTKPVHVVLAEKLRQRKEEVMVGDRIPYIYVECDDPKKNKSELGEDPKWAKDHHLKYNRKCYLEQLAKPILGFYKVVLKDNEPLLDETISYVNQHLVRYGGKGLKPSDFKIED